MNDTTKPDNVERLEGRFEKDTNAEDTAAKGRIFGSRLLDFDGDALPSGLPRQTYTLVYRNHEGEALVPTAVYIARPYPDNRSWSLIKRTGTGISATEDKIGLFTPEAWELLRQATFRYPPAL